MSCYIGPDKRSNASGLSQKMKAGNDLSHVFVHIIHIVGHGLRRITNACSCFVEQMPPGTSISSHAPYNTYLS